MTQYDDDEGEGEEDHDDGGSFMLGSKGLQMLPLTTKYI